ncbi:hypothetical protein GW17_00001938 [Ensete ventricosum]|uniref:Uncharacterized protein n=1 Tax=Ensete ventricosum TaxID=4639 RepID=A0A444GEX7_ENSVE|nr:hypothetical protein GW17_00001938 [Ensete ventricosum]RZR71874.1 hypothetical protein BHM03_00008261 [Ensete ventricosum]
MREPSEVFGWATGNLSKRCELDFDDGFACLHHSEELCDVFLSNLHDNPRLSASSNEKLLHVEADVELLRDHKGPTMFSLSSRTSSPLSGASMPTLCSCRVKEVLRERERERERESCRPSSSDGAEQKMTIIGEMDPVKIAKKLKKIGKVDIVSVGPAKEEKKEEKKAEKK